MILHHMKLWNSLKKNKILCLFFFFIYLNVSSQTHRFFYLTKFKSDSLGIYQNDITCLEISSDRLFFLSNKHIKTDSINNLKNQAKFLYPEFKQIIKKNLKNDNYQIVNYLSTNYYSIEKYPNFNWKLLNEYKKIGKYSVQKAITNYGNRSWIAWFTNEIPLNYGPYIFNGLPGLILEIRDKSENYIFTFIGNTEKEKNISIEKYLDSYISDRLFHVTEKKWKDIQIDFYNSPLKDYINGNAVMFDNGKELQLSDYKKLEKEVKERIKRKNNPIELDSVIEYD